jgi:hypothetical protein
MGNNSMKQEARSKKQEEDGCKTSSSARLVFVT